MDTRPDDNYIPKSGTVCLIKSIIQSWEINNTPVNVNVIGKNP